MWIYEQGTGRISRNGNMLTIGYSGNGDGLNNPAMQDVHNEGPIPQGTYRMADPVETSSHGPFVIPLQPDPTNEMYGRSEFLIHGDLTERPGEHLASQGCIVAARFARERMWDSGDHLLQVVEILPDQIEAT